MVSSHVHMPIVSVVDWVRHAKISSNLEIRYTILYMDGDICIVSVDWMYFMTGETKLLLLLYRYISHVYFSPQFVGAAGY